MLQLRYNGCPQCLNTVETILRAGGFFPRMHYTVEFHDDHRNDKIYAVRPDYLLILTGAILYNPETGHWLDFYDKGHERVILTAKNDVERKKMIDLVKALQAGQ